MRIPGYHTKKSTVSHWHTLNLCWNAVLVLCFVTQVSHEKKPALLSMILVV